MASDTNPQTLGEHKRSTPFWPRAKDENDQKSESEKGNNEFPDLWPFAKRVVV